jgi:predicted ATPase
MSKDFRGINRIEVDKYKSINNLTLDFGAITVLAGVNSSGKSSAMQPLLLMKQTFDMNSNSALFLQGKNVDLTSFDQIKTRLPDVENKSFSLRIQTGNFSAQSTFTGNEDEITLDSTRYYFFDPATGEKNREITLSSQTSSDDLRAWVVQTYNGFDHITTDTCTFQPRPEACFYGICYDPPKGKEPTIAQMLRPSEFFLQRDIQGIIHLPGLRDNPQRRDKKISLDQQPIYRGCFPKYTASVIESWGRHQNGKHTKLLTCLNEMRLATNITAEGSKNSAEIELKVSRVIPARNTDHHIKSEDDLVSIAEVGFGVSQALPIITALIAAEKNQIVYVEQPETHLHPYAQIGLVKAIIIAAQRDVRVVVETHSATFLLTLQTMIAKGEHSLSENAVALYWFYQDEYGETKTKPSTMQVNGTFGDWPADFSDVTMELQLEFMRAFEKHENK